MRSRAVDEIEHFSLHDARIIAQEKTDGNLVWTLDALNVTTAFSGYDFETDREIGRARMTFEAARPLPWTSRHRTDFDAPPRTRRIS